MSTIEINLHVNVSLSDDVKSFLTGLFGSQQVKPEVKHEAAPAQVAAPTQASASAMKPATESVAKQAAAPKPTTKPSVTIDAVRTALMQKVNNNRAAIKDKLTELGAKSVTSLDPSKYEEMLDFLNSLQ